MIGDYLALAKPRLILLAALAAALSFHLASPDAIDWTMLVLAFAGSYLTGAAASVFNQILERDTDARMKRTENRPLPAGRISLRRAMVFGALLTAAGMGLLTYVNALTGLLGFLTLATYLGVYTPMKRRTAWNTLAGAVPGALPCLMGWAAARNRLDPEAFMLFLILFLWQMPHFFSIAWVYREDYRAAGLRMLTTEDATGRLTAVQIIFFSVLVLLASLWPVQAGWAGSIYLISALAAGAALVTLAAVLAATRLRFARGFAMVSIYYLIILMSGLAVDRL